MLIIPKLNKLIRLLFKCGYCTRAASDLIKYCISTVVLEILDPIDGFQGDHPSVCGLLQSHSPAAVPIHVSRRKDIYGRDNQP